MPKPKVRKGMPSVQLTKEEFSKRFRERFYDPTFSAVAPEIERVIAVAWKNYIEYHKSPARGGPALASAILTFRYPWNGSKRVEPFYRRKDVRRVPNPIRAFFSSTAPPAAIKPVREKCRKLFVWRK
jgi:hypothetical protein